MTCLAIQPLLTMIAGDERVFPHDDPHHWYDYQRAVVLAFAELTARTAADTGRRGDRSETPGGHAFRGFWFLSFLLEKDHGGV